MDETEAPPPSGSDPIPPVTPPPHQPPPGPMSWSPPPAPGATGSWVAAPRPAAAPGPSPDPTPAEPWWPEYGASAGAAGIAAGAGGMALVEAEVAGEAIEEDAAAAGGAGHGHRREGGRFRSIVAVLIALTSIMGALVAFRGSITEQRAVRLDQDGIQEQARQEQILTDIEATVNDDLRRLGPYQEHLKASELLASAATSVQATDAALAEQLQAQSASENVLAISEQQFFRAFLPDEPSADKPLTYDRENALTRLKAQDQEFRQLRPAATIAQADASHHKASVLTGLVTIFIAGLFFLTLAQFAGRSIRLIFAVAGVLAAVGGTAAWVVVERTLA